MQSLIGTIIKKLRLSKNMIQKELCLNICSIKQLSRIEQNISSPSAFLLFMLSEKLGHELLDFLPYSNDEMGYELKLIFDHLNQLYLLDQHEEVYKIITSSLLLNHTSNPRSIQERDWLLGAISHYIQTDIKITAVYFFNILTSKFPLKHIEDVFNYQLSELDYRVLNSYIVYLIEASEIKISIQLLTRAIDHYEKHYSTITDPVYTRFIFNLANLLFSDDTTNALKWANKGIQHCLQVGQLTFLQDLYLVGSKSAYILGDAKTSQQYHYHHQALSQMLLNSDLPANKQMPTNDI